MECEYCGRSCDCDEGDLWTELSDTTPKAREAHLCDFCQKPIEKGVIYRKQTAISEGDLVCVRRHLECVEEADKREREFQEKMKAHFS